MRLILVAPTRSDPAHRRVLSSLKRELLRSGDRVMVFPPRDGLSAERSRAALETALRAGEAPLCHVQFFSRGLGYLESVRFPAGTRLVLTHQGASLDLLKERAAFRRLARRANAVTAVSKAGLSELLASFPELKPKASWVPNGADAPKDLPSPRIPARPFILAASRLAAYKGIDVLLLAFSRFAERRPGVDLLLCGPDQSGGRMQDFARRLGLAGRVRFLGDTKPAALSRLMRASLFFVLPSRQENLPMALVEAMAAGKAVVASRTGGVPELVRDGDNGLLVAPGDAAGLECALERLASDPGLRRRLGRRAKGVSRLFGWRSVAGRYRNLYGRVLS